MLEARNLAAGFGTIPLFQNISLRLEAGRILGLRGRSGAGKTTLGRVLAGLHPRRQARFCWTDRRFCPRGYARFNTCTRTRCWR